MDGTTTTQRTNQAGWSLIVDGPPVWVVTILFAGLLAISWGESDPSAGLAVFAVGMVVALGTGAVPDAAWRRRPSGDDGAADEPPPLLFTGPPRSPPPERPRRVP